MNDTPDRGRLLKGREILGAVTDRLSAWFTLGAGLVRAWRALDAETRRVRARPLVEALVRRCNQHRQAAWLEFVATCTRWHAKSRDGHFLLLSPRSFQDEGRRRADPFNETSVLKLLNAYRKGALRPQDAYWVMDAFCYAVATTVPGAKERVLGHPVSAHARLLAAEAERLFAPRTADRRRPPPRGLLDCLRTFISSDDARVGRFNRIWRERLDKKGGPFRPDATVVSVVAWLVEHLDPAPGEPQRDLPAYCRRMRALGRFGQQIRLQLPPSSGTPGKVEWTDRLAQNLIRLGKLAELLLGGPVARVPVELDYLGLGPARPIMLPRPSPPAQAPPLPRRPEADAGDVADDLVLSEEPAPHFPHTDFGLPDEEPAESETADELVVGPDLPDIADDDPHFPVSRPRAQRAPLRPDAGKDAEARPRPPEPLRTAAVNGRTEAEPIHFHCGACRRSLCVPATHVGRRFRCPECGTESRIPAVSELVAETGARRPPPVEDIFEPVEDEPEVAPEQVPGPEPTPPRNRSRRKKSPPSKVRDPEDPEDSAAARAGWRKVRRGLRVLFFTLIVWTAAVALTLVAAFLIPVAAGGTARLGTLGNDLRTAQEAGTGWVVALFGITAIGGIGSIVQLSGYTLCLYMPSRPGAVAGSVGALVLTGLGGGLYVGGLAYPVVAFVAVLLGLGGWLAFLSYLRAVGVKLDVSWIVYEIQALTQFIVVGTGTAGLILVGLFLLVNQVTDPQRASEGMPTVLLFGIGADVVLFAALLGVVLFRYLQVLRHTSAQIEEEIAARARPRIGDGAAAV